MCVFPRTIPNCWEALESYGEVARMQDFRADICAEHQNCSTTSYHQYYFTAAAPFATDCGSASGGTWRRPLATRQHGATAFRLFTNLALGIPRYRPGVSKTMQEFEKLYPLMMCVRPPGNSVENYLFIIRKIVRLCNDVSPDLLITLCVDTVGKYIASDKNRYFSFNIRGNPVF